MTAPSRPNVPARLFAAALRPWQRFLALEASAGILLLAAAAAALAWANSPGAEAYEAFRTWRPTVAGLTAPFDLHGLVNDGLMTFFFLVVGLEIKHELVAGNLRTVARALYPAVGAVGGMVVPALVYALVARGTPAGVGWGIPMATDIAFCAGALTLLGTRVPRALVVFVTALAIFDDIGGILVIAAVYGTGLQAGWLVASAVVAGLLVVAGRRGLAHPVAFAIGGAALWGCLHEGGIHATLAGVVLGLAAPSGSAEAEADPAAPPSALDRFMAALHGPVAYVVVPLFALVNAGVSLGDLGHSSSSPAALGAALGLVVGKPTGIVLAVLVASRFQPARVAEGATLARLTGVGVLAGIGFTVAVFMAALAFPEGRPELGEAKVGILVGSVVAGLAGLAILWWSGERRVATAAEAGAAPP